MRIDVGLILSSLGEVCVIWTMVWLAQARGSRLSEITWWCYYIMLAQARWTSLSEAEGLAWARVPGLSEFMWITMFVCLCVLVWLLFLKYRKYMHVEWCLGLKD